MTRRWKKVGSALLVAGVTTLGATLSAPAQAQEVTVDIMTQRMSIKAYLQLLSDKFGFKFIDEVGIEGEISVTGGKLNAQDALSILETWLSERERGIVPTDKIIQIMTRDNIRKMGKLPVVVGKDPEKVPQTDKVVTQVIQLNRIKASDARTAFDTLKSTEGSSSFIEPSSNTLVVTDKQAVIKRLLQILTPLDESKQLELTVKAFHLKNANADEVAQVIKDLFPRRQGGQGQGGQGGAQNPQQMIRQFFGGGGGGPGGGGGGGGNGGGGGRGGRGGGGQAGEAALENSEVNVSIEKRSNSVIVAAAKSQMDLIDNVVKDLEATQVAITLEVKSFVLKNANPIDMAAVLQDIYAKPTVQGQQQQGGPGGFFRQMAGGGNNAGQAQGDGPTKYLPDPKFTVDMRTNSLIVSAVASQVDQIEKLIHDLDENNKIQQGVLVVPLRNGDAANIAKVLTDLLNAAGNQRAQNQNASRVQGAQTTALAELAGEVKVVADTDSNSLIVTTSPKNFPRLRQIISDLDRPRKQVLLDCLIAEVTLDDAGQLGVQWSTNWIRDAAGRVGGTSQAGTFGGLGALSSGFQYLSTSDKLSLTLQALQTQGKLNVLSSPKILAMENQTAQISVGQDVPFINNSTITQTGEIRNTVQYRNIGVILKLTPKINEKGEVRMTVHPEVSEKGPDSEAVPISNGVNSPVFNDNFADTTVVVNDGETAVLGGLIRNELTETVQKLPIVGDIPILGLAFRSTSVDKKKIELLVLLTPHVLDDADMVRRRSRQEMDRYMLVPQELLNDDLDSWTRGLESGSAVRAYNRGTVYLDYHRYEQAIEELKQARDLGPDDAATHFNLGLSYGHAGRLDDAMVELNEAQRLDPRDAETHYNLGAILWRKQDYNGATREFRACLQLDPEHSDARKWLDKAERAVKDVPLGAPQQGDGK